MNKEKKTALIFFIILIFLYLIGFKESTFIGVPLHNIHTVFAGIFVIIVGLFPLFIVKECEEESGDIIESDPKMKKIIESSKKRYSEKNGL